MNELEAKLKEQSDEYKDKEKTYKSRIDKIEQKAMNAADSYEKIEIE